MRTTLTTEAAAMLVGVNPRSLRRWARRRGVEPLRRQRIGESYITVWSYTDILTAGTADVAA